MSIPPHHIVGDLGHTTDHNSIVDVLTELDVALVGPPFVSAAAYAAVPESLVCDCSATVGGAPNAGTWFNTNASAAVAVTTTAGQFTQGTSAISLKALNCGIQNNPYLSANGGVNFSSPITVGTHSYIAVDIRPTFVGGGSAEFFELVLSSAVATATGSVYTWDPSVTRVLAMPVSVNTANVFYTVYLPAHGFTSIRSLGVRTKDWGTGDNKNGSVTWIFDNIRWAQQSELDRALEFASQVTALIPPDYSSSQRTVMLQAGQNVVDLRGNPMRVTARDAQVYPEDGSADVTSRLCEAIANLPDGGRFELTPGAIYRLDGTWMVSDKSRITIDGNDATLLRPTPNANTHLELERVKESRIRNLRMVDYEPEVYVQGGTSGHILESDAGTPTLSGGLATLTSQGDAVRINAAHNNPHGRNEDGNIRVDVTLYDTSGTANDCLLEWYDQDAPTAPTGLTATAGGAVPPGTWYYRVTYVDAEGNETAMGPYAAVTLAGYSYVTMTIPTATNGNAIEGTNGPLWVKRRIYGTNTPDAAAPWKGRAYGLLLEIPDNTTTTYVDTNARASTATVWTGTVTDTGVGNLGIGLYNYYVSTVDGSTGRELVVSARKTITTTRNCQTTVAGLPAAVNGGVRRIYRSAVAPGGGSKQYGYWLADVSSTAATSYVDNISDATLTAGSVGRRAVDDASGFAHGRFVSMGTEVFTITGRSGTPQTKRFEHKPLRMDRHLGFRVKKLTAASDPIVISAVTTYGRCHYTPAVEFATGVQVTGGCDDLHISDIHTELMSGDAVNFIGGLDIQNVFVERVTSQCSRRQGMSVTSGRSITFKDCRILESARTGMDIEPTGLTEADQIVLDNVEFRMPVNNGISAIIPVPRIYMKNCWMHNAHGALGGFDIEGPNVSIQNCHFQWNTCRVDGRDLYVDGLTASVLRLGASLDNWQGFRAGIDGSANRAVVRNVRLTGTAEGQPAFRNEHPNSVVQNVTVGVEEALPLTGRDVYPPVKDYAAGTGSVYSAVDFGVIRESFPDTFKGMVAGDVWFPRGLDLRRDGLRRTRSISSGETPGNNLWGTSVITGGATTATVPFTYSETPPDITNFSLSGNSSGGGTMVPGAYRYRVVARSALGGPVVSTQAEKSITLTTATAVNITVTGVMSGTHWLEGVTVYRSAVGAGGGLYTTRYDVVPNDDLFFLGSTESNTHVFRDLGTTLQAFAGDAIGGTGYSDAIAPTPTTGFPLTSWDGSKWIVALELAFEPNATYAVILQPWWGTTAWMTAARRDGFDVAFGTAAPPGPQRMDWFIVR